MGENGAGELNAFDRISEFIGRATAWLTLFMVLVTGIVVVMRYAFDAGFIWMQESVVWMHAAVFMLGAAYTLRHEDHVRVDIFYRNMNPRRRSIVDLLGVVFFLLPVCGFLAYKSYDFAAAAWSMREITREPGGLPYPAIPMLKSLVMIMPITLALQGVSMILRALFVLRRG